LKLSILPNERKDRFDLQFFKAIAELTKSSSAFNVNSTVSNATTIAASLNHRRSFARTYASLCRQRKQTIRPTLVAFLESIPDSTLTLSAARYHLATSADWLPLLEALRYTRSFNRIDLCDCRLPADAFGVLTAALACSRQVRQLQLTAVQTDSPSSFAEPFTAATSALQLTQLHLEDVAIGDRGIQSVVKVLGARKWPLRLLRLRQVGATPVGVGALIGALRGEAAHVLSTLSVLDLGGGKIDAKVSAVLGEVLSKAALTELVLDDMGALDLDAVGFGVSAGCPELKTLDVSLAKLTKKALPKQLSLSAQLHLREFRASGLALGHDVVVPLLSKSNVVKLTLSDYDFGERLGDVFGALQSLQALQSLVIDSVLSPKSPIDAFDILKPVLSRLAHLSARGGSSRRATPSLLSYLLEAIAASGEALQELRIGGHEGGDALCVSLNAILSTGVCPCLERVEFDENKSSIDGIVAFADGLMRCRSVRHSDLPLCDLSAILATAKPSNNVAERVTKLTEQIQGAVARNAAAGSPQAVALAEQVREQIRDINLLIGTLEKSGELAAPVRRIESGLALEDGGNEGVDSPKIARRVSGQGGLRAASPAPGASGASGAAPAAGPWRGGRLQPTTTTGPRKGFLN
jgi:hypothetical protein